MKKPLKRGDLVIIDKRTDVFYGFVGKVVNIYHEYGYADIEIKYLSRRYPLDYLKRSREGQYESVEFRWRKYKNEV